MPDISALFKSEIARLSRKTVRQHVEPLRSIVAAQRQQLSALKKQVSQLERELTKLRRVAAPKVVPTAADSASDAAPTQVRFVAKGLKSLRARLGLSAEDLGRLIGVSTQTIYNWEAKKTAPRSSQLGAIAAVRGLGKKDAEARLELLGTAKSTPARRRPQNGEKPQRKPRAAAAKLTSGAGKATKSRSAAATAKAPRKPRAAKSAAHKR